MWEKVITFAKWFYEFWKGLDEKDKEKIIDVIVSAYDWVFRKMYRDSKGEKA